MNSSLKQKYFSTSEIANMLEVNRYTVSLWIDHGEMKAMITPGGHKKVARDEVIKFIRSRGGAVPAELEPEKSKRVFIIDDEKEVGKYLSRCIQIIFPDVTSESFDSPVHGLIEIGKSIPDMVILDIVMPDMDGINVCKMIREKKETENIKIIAMSGKFDKATIQRVMDAGADDFYYKISPIDELMNSISKRLDIAPDEIKLQKLVKKL